MSEALNGHSQGHRGLNDLLTETGPPLTTTEMAWITGMSATFIRGEIRTGHLRAIQVGRGRKRVFRIQVRHARAYIRQLGLI